MTQDRVIPTPAGVTEKETDVQKSEVAPGRPGTRGGEEQG